MTASLSAGEIAAHFDVTRPAVSQHLTVLKEAGLVDERRDGTRRLYRARPEGLDELQAFLEEFWGDRLDASNARQNERSGRTMETTAEKTPVERELTIAARPETVWEFLVDPDKLARWMGRRRRSTLVRAGSTGPRSSPGTRRARRVRRGRPAAAARLHVGLGAGRDGPNVPPGSSTVEIELEPHAEGTPLRFTHRGLPSAKAAEAHAHGWDHYLERLRVAASGGDPGPDPWLSRQV